MAVELTSRAAHQPDLSSLCLAITEHAPLPMATVEGASHIVRYVNPAFCRLMDKPAEQLVGKPFAEMLPEKDVCVTLLDRVFRTGKSESHTEQQHSKPHSVFWTYTMWPVLADELPVGVMIQVTETAQFHEKTVAMNEALMLGSVRQHELTEASENLNAQLRTEITERKQAEQRVRTSEIRYRRLFEAAQGGILILDPKTRKITEANPYIIELLGYPREQLLGKELWEIGLLKDKEASQKAFLELKAKGFIRYESLPLETKADQRREVEFVSNLYQENGEAVIQCNIRDVTDRKKAEQELSEKARLLDLSNDAIIVHDLDDKISSWNKGAEELYGWTSEEVIGKHLDSLLQMEFPKPMEEIVAQLQSEGHFSGEVVQIARDGRRVRRALSLGSGPGHEIDIDQLHGHHRTQAEEALLPRRSPSRWPFSTTPNFSRIPTKGRESFRSSTVGAERMLGYTAAEVMNKITPADISDPQEVIARAKALSAELETKITPGFEALVFKASRGIEDIYELTYIRKDGSRFPAVVSVTALRDAQDAIIGYLLIGTDNTARKQVEEERQKLDQRLRDQQFYTRSLIESNIDALMTTDPSSIITDVNKQMEALTGCTRDELIGSPFKNYFTDSERAEAAIKLVLSEKKLTNYELTTRARDGKETVVSYNATTFYDRDRKLQGVFAAARDVTERKQAERAITEVRDYAESIIRTARDPIMVLGAGLRVVSVSEAFLQTFKLAQSETEGRLVYEVGNGEWNIPRLRELLEEILPRNRFFNNFEVTHDFESIGQRTMLLNARTLRESSDQPAKILLGIEDITERKQTQRAITEVRDYAESIIRTARDPMMVLGADLRVVSVSEAFLQTFKLAQSETEGRLVYEVGNGEWNIPRLRELLEEILPRENLFNNFEVTHDFENIGQRTMLLNARTLRESSGQPAKILLGIEDITERKQTEEALRESETRVRALFESAEAARLSAEAAKTRAEAATRAKDDFLAALSHELRTPLNPALLLATSLADDAALPPRVREDIDVIARGIALQAQLVDDMLDITRITTGKLRLDLQPIDAHSVLRQVYEILRTDVQERQIDVTLDLAAPHNCIKADAVRVQQIFWNVLKNAVKFTPPGGAITVRTRNPADKEGMLAVEITDTGIGIEPGILGKVFDAFIQEEHDGAHRFGGLGLGLAITRRLVEAQHGQIHAESAGRGHGATFRIELPLEEPGLREAEGLAPVRPTAGVAAARCILLVEDHEPTRSTLVRLLERRGHKVVGVTTAAAAREIAAARDCDLVISDLGLPDGDGHALMAELRDAYGLHGIALSGYGMEEDLERSRRSGFFTHLTKPVDIHALESAIAIAPQTRSAL